MIAEGAAVAACLGLSVGIVAGAGARAVTLELGARKRAAGAVAVTRSRVVRVGRLFAEVWTAPSGVRCPADDEPMSKREQRAWAAGAQHASWLP